METRYKVTQISFDLSAEMLRKTTDLKINKVIGIVQDVNMPGRGHVVYTEAKETK